MKTSLMAMVLFATSGLMAQISIDAGLSSRMQGTWKLAYEQQAGWMNAEAGARQAGDNLNPVIGMQAGYSSTNPFQHPNFRIMAGGYYHTGLLPVNKLKREGQVRFGGSVRYEQNHGLLSLEYNGETLNLTLGFIFKRKNYSGCRYRWN